jgi:hypothetical protein
MLQDIGAAMGNPRDEILRYPPLVPAPLLAALPALPAILLLWRDNDRMSIGCGGF